MEKIYGIYPGSVKDEQDYFAQCSEVELYFRIVEKNGYINFLKADFCDNNGIAYLDINEEYYARDYMICLTRRYGVEVEPSSTNKRIQITRFLIAQVFRIFSYKILS